jgi:hypothetical protein
MIGESSGVTTLINNERIYRENQLRSENKASDQGEETLAASAGNFSDVTSFSSEALALAGKVVPVGGSGAEGKLEQQDQDQKRSPNSATGLLDIRV